MSTTLSNLNVPRLFSSKRNTGLKPTFVKFQPLSVKSMAGGGGNGRSDLDHLQRTNKPQQKRGTPQGGAPIGLWDRFPNARTIEQMMDTMESLMEDPFAYNNTWAASPLQAKDNVGGGYRRGRTPWEIKEGENEYKMRFDMPGMTRTDVKVWVEDNMMVVTAEKVPKKKNGEEGVADEEDEWSPKSYGKYKSRIALPDNVAFDKIKAEVKDGVLYITIPKASPTSKVLDISVQ